MPKKAAALCLAPARAPRRAGDIAIRGKAVCYIHLAISPRSGDRWAPVPLVTLRGSRASYSYTPLTPLSDKEKNKTVHTH